MKMSTKVKFILLLVVLVIEYNLPFPVHLKHPEVGDGKIPTWAEMGGNYSSQRSNKIEFPHSGEVERSKVPYVLMAITLPIGLFVIYRRKK